MDDVIDMHDVTVRIPVHMTGAETAGFIQGAVTRAMRERNWVGEAFVIWKDNDRLVAFNQGIVDPYEGVLPHDG